MPLIDEESTKIHFHAFEHVMMIPKSNLSPHFMSGQERESQHPLDVSETGFRMQEDLMKSEAQSRYSASTISFQNATLALREPTLMAPPFGTLKA